MDPESDPEKMTDEKAAVLRSVGIVLIVVGLIDIVLMITALHSRQPYASGLNIFAVIAGVMLLNANVRTAKGVLSFAALVLGSLTVALLWAVLSVTAYRRWEIRDDSYCV